MLVQSIPYPAEIPGADYGFVAASSVQFGSTSPIEVPYPAEIEAGDLLVVQVARTIGTGSTTYTTPTGWERIADSALNIANSYHLVFVKIADGSESGTLSISYSGGTDDVDGAAMSVWRGVSAATPYENLQSFQRADTRLKSSRITTSHDNQIVLTLHGTGAPDAIAAPSGEDETCYSGSSTISNDLSLLASYRKFPGPGENGFSLATVAASANHGVINLALVAETPTAFAGSAEVTVTVPAGRVATDLTDFVTLVNLANFPAAWWAAVQSDGGDIRARDSSGGAIIPHDLVEWDYASEKGWLAVKKTLLAASPTSFVVECGGSGMTALAAGDANGQHAVWDDYEAVYFFNGNLNDRTANARNLTVKTGSAAYADVWGGCGNALDTSAAAFQASIDNAITPGNVFTMSATLVMDVNTSENQQAMTFCQTFGSSSARVTLGNENDLGWTSFSSADSWLTQGTIVVGDQSVRMACVYNGATDRKLYRQGILAATDATITGTIMDTLCIGGGSASGANWRGRIGFAYLRLQEMSAAWLAAEARNLNSPQRFYDLS